MGYSTVAVVGGGLFGATAAIELSRRGYRVTLVEQEGDLFQGASGSSQNRLHAGYHYPRSIETLSQLQQARHDFYEMYSPAISAGDDHYYAISSKDSKTSAEAFVEFCSYAKLPYEMAGPDILKKNTCDICIKVPEALLDPITAKEICRKYMRELSIVLRLNTIATPDMLSEYDAVVIAAYAGQNELLLQCGLEQQLYKYELCEKPVVALGPKFKNLSLVILDGPFMCVNPYAQTGDFLLGNVKHAVHSRNVGPTPIIPTRFAGLLNKGLVPNPPISNFHRFVDDASSYLTDMAGIKHLGSFFTLRMTLPFVESTDERPSIVRKHSGNVFTIWSGKLVTCVTAARQLADMIQG